MRSVALAISILIFLAAWAAPCVLAQDPARKDALAAELRAVEQSCNGMIRSFSIDSPVEQILPVRAVYADDFGVVLITEVDLVQLSPLFGFGGLKPGELAQVHAKKLRNLPLFVELMSRLLLDAAQRTPHLPPQARLLMQARFYYADFEKDRSGLPFAWTVQARKQDLLDVASGKVPHAALSGILKGRAE